MSYHDKSGKFLDKIKIYAYSEKICPHKVNLLFQNSSKTLIKAKDKIILLVGDVVTNGII